MAEATVDNERPFLYSVGHSNVQLEVLSDLLSRHDIDVVADVRTAPRSRYAAKKIRFTVIAIS